MSEKRPTNIVIVGLALALILFLPMLLGALLLVGNNVSDGASVGSWLGSLAFADFSAVLVWLPVRRGDALDPPAAVARRAGLRSLTRLVLPPAIISFPTRGSS